MPTGPITTTKENKTMMIKFAFISKNVNHYIERQKHNAIILKKKSYKVSEMGFNIITTSGLSGQQFCRIQNVLITLLQLCTSVFRIRVKL